MSDINAYTDVPTGLVISMWLVEEIGWLRDANVMDRFCNNAGEMIGVGGTRIPCARASSGDIARRMYSHVSYFFIYQVTNEISKGK